MVVHKEGSSPKRVEVLSGNDHIRVLLLISSLEHGGAERQVVHLANHLPRDRFEVTICSLSEVISLADCLHDPRQVRVIRKRWKFDAGLVPRVAALMRRLRIDIVHAFLLDAEIVARLAARLAGVPVVIASERNADYRRPMLHSVATRLTRCLYDTMITNSHAGKRFNIRTLGLQPRHIEVIHNGVDVDLFRPIDGSSVRCGYGIGASDLVVGMVAMFKAQKNHALFFKVARAILAKRPNTYFWCAGEPLRDNQQGAGDYHLEMLKLVGILGLQDHVRFLGTSSDMPAVYSACDLTMLTSVHEGVPNVLLESMACGVPVVATDVADNARIVPDGRAGYVVSLQDEQTLVSRVDELLGNAQQRREFGEYGRAWVCREFSIEALVNKTSAVYERWLTRKSGLAPETRCRRNGQAQVPVLRVMNAPAFNPIPDRPKMQEQHRARLLAYPYPFRAMLAICSDLDETPDRNVYWEIQRFLNTTQTTSMGQGVGIEVGNSIYFGMPPSQFAYWTTDDRGRAMVHALIHSGHIDCLHSFGDLVCRRNEAERCLDELTRHDCQLRIWVDHSKAPSNFGPDLMAGSGDVSGSPIYHADLTLQFGIRYVWRGRTTSLTGQNVPPSGGALLNMVDPRHPFASTRNTVKQMAKIGLGSRGYPRWAMHAENRVRRSSTLRDGQKIWELLRSNPFFGGSGKSDTADGIADVLTGRMLATLSRRGGVCILYTHLGKVRDPRTPFQQRTRDAFLRLARAQEDGQVFVTTTYRLMNYLMVRDHLVWEERTIAGRVAISLGKVHDPVTGTRPATENDAQGLSFVLARTQNVEIRLQDGSPLPVDVVQQGGQTVATVRWRRLEFPDL